MKKAIVIAHRGASAYAPENTMAAFKRALDMKADGIEIDVHLTKDGCIVVAHDEQLGRTCNGSGFIKDLTLKELKELDFGGWFSSEFANEKIPTLDELLSFLKDKDILLNIEIKNSSVIYRGIEKAVVDIVKKYDMTEKVIISSFNHYCLKEIKKIAPEFKIGLLYTATLYNPGGYARMVGAEAIHPYFSYLNPDAIKNCKENGVLINAWTINNAEQIKNAITAGIDGIITNYPDIAKNMIETTK